MKIVKVIVVIILFLFESLMSLSVTAAIIEGQVIDTLGYGLAAAVLFYGFAIVSLAELFRMRRGREKIILPMLGMKVIVVSLGLAVGMFADYSATGDKNALWVSVMFVALTVALIFVGFGIKYTYEQKKSARDGGAGSGLEEIGFAGFSAEWYYDDVAAEYVRLHNPYVETDDTAMFSDEDNDRIYAYACNRIAYLFVWLLKRDGLNETLLAEFDQEAGRLNELRSEQGNPSDFIYYYLDGKLCKDDVEFLHLLFLHTYYERLGLGGRVREVSYGRDYDEIVLGSVIAEPDILYCFDFSWEKYRLFEKRLDERYETFLKENTGEKS